MQFRTISLALLAASLSVGALNAQNLFRPPPKKANDQVTLGWRGMFSVDVTFSKLGGVGIIDPNLSSDGGFYALQFNDGYISKDNSFITLNPNSDGKTTNFSYTDPTQVSNGGSTGALIDYHSYGALTNNAATYATDSGMANGWELQYTHYFGRKQRFGILAGFSFSTFETTQNGSVTTDLLTSTYQHQTGTPWNEFPKPSTPTTGPGYTGSAFRSSTAGSTVPDYLINFPASSLDGSAFIPTTTADGAIVTGTWGLKASFYTFRLGPVYDISLNKKFRVQVGAGLTSIFFSGDYSADESVIAVANMTGAPTTYYKSQRDSKWLVGGYVDANANYQFTDRVNFFSGMEYQTTNNFTGYNDAREVQVDMSSQIYMRAGFGFKF